MFQGDQDNLEPQQPPEESSNRTFLIAAGYWAGLFCFRWPVWRECISLESCHLRYRGQQAAAQATQNAQVAQALTATAASASLATPSPMPTDTPVLAEVTSRRSLRSQTL